MIKDCVVQTINFSKPYPIFQEINFNSEDNPFKLFPAKRIEFFKSLRCENIEFIPHAHGTHLETSCHISLEMVPGELDFNLSRPLFTKVIRVDEELKLGKWDESVEFLIFKKTEPKMIKDFEGISPEFLQQAINFHPKAFVFGINEPSFDPENDEGKMKAHHIIFSGNIPKYIVENLNLNLIESSGFTSFYYCFLNIFRYGKTDAYPCSPILYEFTIPANTTNSDKMVLSDSCIFCKIIRGAIPSFKIYETNLTYAFLDINPLSEGHILVIPKFHGGRLHEVTDEHLADILPVARKILLKGFGEDGGAVIPAYNILQNNGKLAHQEVEHVHFHIIPKRNEEEGLGIKWPSKSGNMAELSKYAESLRNKVSGQ